MARAAIGAVIGLALQCDARVTGDAARAGEAPERGQEQAQSAEKQKQ
jgi:hypothetical protein